MSLNELLFQTSAQSLELDYEDAVGNLGATFVLGVDDIMFSHMANSKYCADRSERQSRSWRTDVASERDTALEFLGTPLLTAFARVLINHQNATGNRFIGKIMIKSSEQMGRIWDAVIMLGRRPQNDEAPAREQHQPEGKKLPMIP
ncbi:hypothetical protein MCOR12_007584 [Pyricularia oryzae]|nr:hypothetical protein MCOR12_007584 [Pyricularia oryzae]